ncbi:MAG: rod-binding protein [Verrucomicrobiales bacterium]|nr:rod-binding protein [Verrucomicrobiales bacterium]
MDPVTSSQPSLAAIPMERLAKDPNFSEATKIGEMARQFEAVLLRQILASARQPVIEDEEGEDSSTDKIYDDMVNQQLADSISQSGDFGLARSLTRELMHQARAGQRASPGAEALSLSAEKPAAEPSLTGDARAALQSISQLR